MGNSNWSEETAVCTIGSLDDWQRVGFDQDHEVLVNLHTGEQCEQYYVVPRDQRTHQSIMQEYAFRSRQEGNVVRVLHAARVDSHTLCSGRSQYRILTERIPWRLDDLGELSLQECLFVLVEAVYGYLVLHEHEKEVLVSAKAIGVTPSGKIRVWTNECFAKDNEQQFEPKWEQSRAQRESEIVRDLFEVVRQRMASRKYPSRLQLKISSAVSFEATLNVVYDYSKEAGIRVPPCLKVAQPRSNLRALKSPRADKKENPQQVVIPLTKLGSETVARTLIASPSLRMTSRSPNKNSNPGMERPAPTAEKSTSKESKRTENRQVGTPVIASHGITNHHSSKAILFKQRKQRERDVQACNKQKELQPLQVISQPINRNPTPTKDRQYSPLPKIPSTPKIEPSIQSPRQEVRSPTKQSQPAEVQKISERVNHLMNHHNYTILPKEQYLRQSRSKSRGGQSRSKVTFTFFNSRQIKVEDQPPSSTKIPEQCYAKIEIKEPAEESVKQPVKELADQQTRTTTPRVSEDVVKTSVQIESRVSLTSNGRKFQEDCIIECDGHGLASDKSKRATSPVEALIGLSNMDAETNLVVTKSDSAPSPIETEQLGVLPVTFDYCKLYSRTVNSFLYNNQGQEYRKNFMHNSTKNSGHQTGAESNVAKFDFEPASPSGKLENCITTPRVLLLQTQVDKMCSSFTKESFLSQKAMSESNIELVAKLFPGLPTHESQLASSLEESRGQENLDVLNERHKQGMIYESREA